MWRLSCSFPPFALVERPVSSPGSSRRASQLAPMQNAPVAATPFASPIRLSASASGDALRKAPLGGSRQLNGKRLGTASRDNAARVASAGAGGGSATAARATSGAHATAGPAAQLRRKQRDARGGNSLDGPQRAAHRTTSFQARPRQSHGPDPQAASATPHAGSPRRLRGAASFSSFPARKGKGHVGVGAIAGNVAAGTPQLGVQVRPPLCCVPTLCRLL